MFSCGTVQKTTKWKLQSQHKKKILLLAIILVCTSYTWSQNTQGNWKTMQCSRTNMHECSQTVPATVKGLTCSIIARCWRSTIRPKYEGNAAQHPIMERKNDELH